MGYVVSEFSDTENHWNTMENCRNIQPTHAVIVYCSKHRHDLPLLKMAIEIVSFLSKDGDFP